MIQAKSGDAVTLHYRGMLADGRIIVDSHGLTPIEVTLGADQLMLGVEQAVIGMHPGQSKTVTIPAAEAYGPRHQDLIVEVAHDQLPDNHTLKLGDRLHFQMESGPLSVLVSAISETSVTLDGNHCLAGEDLTFAITLVDILGSAHAGTE